ncbi:MAG: nicotinate-nucleotide diphosphorylase (carboxylating), partial [Vampirovibrionia bacterium]
IMLDNMSIEETKQMIELINHRAITEASGNINLNTIKDVAETGIDYISTSAITVKAPVLDIGMDMRNPVIYL